MPDITVHRHGDRWAVLEAGAESPVKEFQTREAAELAARQMAGGGAVDVVEDDPTDLGRVQGHEPEVEDPQVTAGDPAERSRQPQTGL
jgi:Uncharacterized protein conserved in bacteria (DUF2188)